MADADLTHEVIKEESPKEDKKAFLDIYPIKKGKRMLVFLADFFIGFILAVFIFAVGVFPSGKAIVKYDTLSEQIEEDSKSEGELLISNNLLYKKEENQTFEENLTYTEKIFFSYCSDSSKGENPFYSFYVDICGKDVSYLNKVYALKDYKSFFSTDQFDSKGVVLIKDEYKKMFAPVLDEADQMTETAQEYYSAFTKSFYLKMYYQMIDDIRTADYIPSDSSLVQSRVYYLDSVAKNQTLDNTVVLSAFISYLLIIAVCYVAIPLVNKKGRTMGMMVLKCEKVGSDNLMVISKVERIIQAAYYLVDNMAFLLFVPMSYISFSYLFNLPYLGYTSLVSLIYIISSFCFLLINKFNKTLTDFLTKTIMIDEESLDSIKKVKGYGYDKQIF